MALLRRLTSSVLVGGAALAAIGCGSGNTLRQGNGTDNPNDKDASTSNDAGGASGNGNDAGSGNGGNGSGNGGSGNGTDGGDASADGGVVYHYNCGAFSQATEWTVRDGYRAVVVADATSGLSQPVALTFAEGDYGGKLFVVSAGDATLRRVDVATGAVDTLTGGAAWGATAPALLTTITWDAEHAFDGALYVGDQGSDGDGDSRIYRVAVDGSAAVFAAAPGAGLDDIYALTFAPPHGTYTQGLYVSGDTDGAGVDWGLVDSTGMPHDFTDMAGVEGAEGAAFDPTGRYGGSLWVSRPLGGGYAGDGSITPIGADGTPGTPIATNLGGIHAVTFSERGAFGAKMYAASWSDGTVSEIDPDGTVTQLASGLQLTNYDGNILAVSSDGQVMFVADRLANRIVCIEPVPQ